MAKLFKKSKSGFSLALALVVLAVSVLTGATYADVGDSATACGERKTIYWDGTQATGIATGTGTKEDPYIIKTAEELAWLVTQKIDVTAGKYYEVDDTIGAIVLQSADKADDIIALKDSSAVKTYFESGSFTKWKTTGWEGSGFGGCFDGNGVTIYGLYTKGDRTNAALFSTVEGGCTIRNVAIKNSYISANMTVGSSDLQVGSLFATSLAGGNAPRKDGVVWVDGCTVANNYMYINRITKNQYIRAGVIGTVSEVVVVEDTLVYGNNATYDDGKKMPLIGTSNGFLFAKSSYQEGLVAKHVTDSGQTYVSNSFRNVLSLGSDLVNVNIKAQKRANDPVCFENCYTDGAAGTVQFTDNSWTYAEGQINKVTADNFSAVELGDAFYTTGAMPELKAFHDEKTEIVDNGDGTHSQSCSCGFALSEEEHEMVDGEVKIEGNCTTDRVVTQVCSICGSKGTDKVTTAPGHTAGEAVVENEEAEDCVTAGSYDEVVYCTVCEAEMSRTHIDSEKLGHTFKDIDAKDANCIESGNIAHKVCEVCKKYFAADDTDVYSESYLDYDKDIAIDIDASAHKLVKYGKVDPTYESEGVEEHYACSHCEKLFADAEGKEEVETKDLLIDKLVKEEDKTSTDEKFEEDKTTTDENSSDNNVEVDKDIIAPDTGENVTSVVLVLAVVLLVGVTFVFVIKLRKA